MFSSGVIGGKGKNTDLTVRNFETTKSLDGSG
jgi:hypothetical protein